MTYGTTVTTMLGFDDAVERTRSALAEQGFGVLTEIDVRATLKTKLDLDIEPYLILGACNPALAEQALTAEPDMGLLLPCNVVIRRSPSANTTTVQAINPQTMVQLSNSPAIQKVADQADAHLLAALSALEGLNSNK